MNFLSRSNIALINCFTSPRVVVGSLLLFALFFVAFFAPILAPNDPQDQDLLSVLLPPLWYPEGVNQFPLGTDTLGRCILSRLIYGTRIALYVACIAATGAMILGAILAVLAGYYGGIVDWIISRIVDIWMAFPPVVLALILLVGLGAGVNKVIFAIILIDWTRFCRVIRSEVLIVMTQDYISAARILGFSHLQIMVREILPTVFPLIITVFSIEMGISVIVEAIMSFIGMSVESNVAAWGVMIADARTTMHQSPWSVVFPILAIFFTVLAFNLLGDGLRRVLDPRLAKRIP